MLTELEAARLVQVFLSGLVELWLPARFVKLGENFYEYSHR